MRVEERRRPVQQRSAAKVALVLEAAAQVLQERGLSGYNTNLIAQRAGLSIGTLYQYFPSKEAITAALVQQAHERIVAGLRQVTAETSGMSIGFSINALLQMLLRGQTGSHKLSRILEMEEERLPKSAVLLDLEAEIEALNRAFFGRYVDPERCNDAQLDNVARDTICIVRSMLDVAAQNSALDAPDLMARLYRTIEGYLAPLLPSARNVAA